MEPAILPDGLDEDRLVIIKACRQLRLTNEIRIAEAVARDTNRLFVLVVPEDCALSESAEIFIRTHGVDLRRVR
jgi:hypothetical protein